MELNKSKRIKKSDLSITVLLVIGIIFVLNFFSYQLFFRWDLTENNIFSISKVSKKTVSELDDVVNIKAYFSENLPSQLISLKQEVADILDGYSTFSNGKIRVEFIDPGEDEALQRELYMAGIPQLTFEVFEKDKRELVKGYMGLSISHGGKSESIPAVDRDTSGLEYQLTTAIKKVISEEIGTIGYLTSNGTLGKDAQIKTAMGELSELYNVVDVDLSSMDIILGNIDTLLIMGATEEFLDNQVEAVKAYLENGGAVIVVADGVTIGEGLVANPNNININKILENYGVRLNNDLVADLNSDFASFSQGFITFSSKYPFWPKIVSDGFNQDQVSVSKLESLTLPWVSSIERTGEAGKYTVTTLARTSAKSWQVKDSFNLAPNGITAPQGQLSQYDVAVMVTGNLGDNAYMEKDRDDNGAFKGRLIVVSDSDFITDNFLRNSPDNLTFFQNIVDTLSLDNDLIEIRSKVVSSRPIKDDLTDSERAMMRYLNVFGLTIVVVAYGMFRYYSRRRSKFIDEI